MTEFVLEETVAAPAADVFARLADFAAYGEWLPRTSFNLRCTVDNGQPIQTGSTYTDSGLTGRYEGLVVLCEAPTRLVNRQTLRWFGRRLVEGTQEYDLTPVEGGATRVVHTFRANVFGLAKLLAPIIAWMSRGERTRVLDGLKRSWET